MKVSIGSRLIRRGADLDQNMPGTVARIHPV